MAHPHSYGILLQHSIIEACTVVRTDAGLSESFEVKVGFHQGSVLSPLFFADVMDVVSSEVICLQSCCMMMT